jgi:serine/threonine protein kinase
LIADKWKIAEKIGEGTFSQIYSAYSLDSGKRVAIKVEAPSSLKPVLEWESIILKSLQDCPNVCRYYYHGYVYFFILTSIYLYVCMKNLNVWL